MKFLSVFSGIEAASVAFNPLGWKAVAFSEIEPFPCSLLKHHYPEVPNLGDVTKITAEQIKALGNIDLVCGGFPCQDLSVAGKRKGLSNADGTSTRSGLFFDAMRIADWANPRWLFIENVPGMFSSNSGRDFAAVVGEMAGCEFAVPRNGWRNSGVVVGPRGLVEWTVMDAQYHGVAQRRKRVFLVRDSGDWASRPPIFLEPYRLQGHPAPRRQSRQGITGGIEIGPAGGSFTDLSPTLDTRAKDGPVRNQLAGAVLDVAGTTKSCKDSGGWSNSADHAAAGYMVPVGVTIHGTDKTAKVCSYTEIAGALRARTPGSQENSSTTVLMVPNLHADISPALKARDSKGPSSDGDGDGAILVPMAYRTASTEGLQSPGLHGEIPCERVLWQTCTAGEPGNVGPATTNPERSGIAPMAVRRLVVEECEFLMGFPRGYTNVPHKGKPAADGNRYKALGNSWVVPNVSWIGRRIQDVSAVLESTKKLEAA